MPRGDKSSYSSNKNGRLSTLKRATKSVETSKKEAERRAWAAVNKQDKGGKKSGSGRGKKSSHASSRIAFSRAVQKSFPESVTAFFCPIPLSHLLRAKLR
jgi:hypothetical protein